MMDAVSSESSQFGPWIDALSDRERIARLRSLRAIALIFARKKPSLVSALRRAETDFSALREARQIFESLPTLQRRRIMSIYCDLL